MTFRTRVDSGYVGALFIFTIVTGLFVYMTIANFSFKVLIICLAFLAVEFLLMLPMYFKTHFILEEDGLRIQVGWFRSRKINYCRIFGYQLTTQEAKANYGLSERRIVLYFNDEQGKNDVITISPKDQKGFIDAFTEKTGLCIKPPDPTFREIQDEYDKKTSPEQRREARKKFLGVLIKGYDKEHIKPESPESLDEKISNQEKEDSNTGGIFGKRTR